MALMIELFVCDENGKNLKQISNDNGIYGDHAPAFTADDTGIVAMVFGDLKMEAAYSCQCCLI